MLNYEQALEYIHNTNKFGIKLGLENIKELLKRLGNPQEHLKFVHVAGTNGKGSVVSFISNVLTTAGYNVGKYISPYIKIFNERISCNGVNIDNDELAYFTYRVKQEVDNMVLDGFNHPTEFEIVTAIAFLYYDFKKCDIIVLEVGLGGRFDSTNVIDKPLVSVITPISIDHVKYLGDTLEKIAFEKAGIIKKGCPVISAAQKDDVKFVLDKQATKMETSCIYVDEAGFSGEKLDILLGGQFEGIYRNQKITINEKLIGEHQIENAKLAFLVLKELDKKGITISQQSLFEGFLTTRWSGRLEIINDLPLTIIDGAHNSAGANVLYNVISKIMDIKKNLFVIIGVMADKEVDEIVKDIIPLAHTVFAVTPDNERALNALDLKKILLKYNSNVVDIHSPKEAMEKAKQIANDDDIILAFGSLYFIGTL